MHNDQNPMLALFDKIHVLTDGYCKVNPGPFGFGVTTDADRKINLVVGANPDPVQKGHIFHEDIASYDFSVRGVRSGGGGVLEAAEIAAFAADGSNPVEQKIALALQALEGEIVHASRDECNAAFEALADREIAAMDLEREQGLSMGM